MKKLLALVLALVLVLGMGVTAFAVEGENDNSGSITIDKAHLGTTYSIYQILVLDSYNTDINSYVYSPASDLWKTWIQDTTAGGKYLVLNENGTVKWNGTATAAAAAAFAQEALAYAETNGIAPAASATATADADKPIAHFYADPLPAVFRHTVMPLDQYPGITGNFYNRKTRQRLG